MTAGTLGDVFAVEPEAVVSMLFMEKMDSNDAIRIDNLIQYSKYSGYGWSFKYEENAINNEAVRFVFRNVNVKGVMKNGKVIFWDNSLYLLDIMTGEVEEIDIDY